MKLGLFAEAEIDAKNKEDYRNSANRDRSVIAHAKIGQGQADAIKYLELTKNGYNNSKIDDDLKLIQKKK